MIREIPLEDVFSAIKEIPEFDQTLTLADLQIRCGEGRLALGFYIEEKLCGFKLGYPVSKTVFYSWLGGVKPDYRGQGVAQQLLQAQEGRVTQQGYKYLDVKSMNRFPKMLRLLIGAGYAIVDIENPNKTVNSDTLKICFRKTLM